MPLGSVHNIVTTSCYICCVHPLQGVQYIGIYLVFLDLTSYLMVLSTDVKIILICK